MSNCTPELLAVSKLGNNADQFEIYKDHSGATVAVTYNDPEGRMATLMSVAPEMLEVLERCADFMGSVAHSGRGPSKVSDTFRQAYRDARAVIKKAKGETL